MLCSRRESVAETTARLVCWSWTDSVLRWKSAWLLFNNMDQANWLLKQDGGNDKLYGNDLENVLMGMRGNDTIVCGTGNDTIDGGTVPVA